MPKKTILLLVIFIIVFSSCSSNQLVTQTYQIQMGGFIAIENIQVDDIGIDALSKVQSVRVICDEVERECYFFPHDLEDFCLEQPAACSFTGDNNAIVFNNDKNFTSINLGSLTMDLVGSTIIVSFDKNWVVAETRNSVHKIK